MICIGYSHQILCFFIVGGQRECYMPHRPTEVDLDTGMNSKSSAFTGGHNHHIDAEGTVVTTVERITENELKLFSNLFE